MSTIYKTLAFLVLLCAWQNAMAQTFRTLWKTDNPGTSASNQITIPTTGGGYNYDIYWEDENDPAVNGILFSQTGDATITFPASGRYFIEITGDFPRIYFNNGGDKMKIVVVEQWGNITWTSMEGAFSGCSTLNIVASDVPDLSGVSNMSNMLSNMSPSGGQNLFISTWNVSNVTDMSNMFYKNISFDQSLSTWDVASVTDMSHMFDGAEAFNQSMGNWNVSNVTNMSYMFSNTSNFNQDISSWNVSNVTDMSFMFAGEDLAPGNAFNLPIDNWDVSKVTNMAHMFSRSNFNQNIGNWDVSSVTNMSSMFASGYFNQDIGSWDVGSVTDMSEMFFYAQNFNQTIGNWDVSNVTTMSYMLNSASSFNQDISSWNVSSVITMSGMFSYTPFNQDIGDWDVSNVTDMQNMFAQAGSFNQDIGNWNTGNLFITQAMFQNATSFNQDISGWDMSNAGYTFNMFRNAVSFNQDISNWDLSNVILMYSMFEGASSFNQNIGSWNIGNVTNMSNMLNNAGLSTANYDATLTGWAGQTLKPNVALGALNLTYCSAVAERAVLIGAPNNWNITGDTQNCDPLTITSFTPISAPIGVHITITGIKFSNNPLNNEVRFNGTLATVTASTTTSITTSVPTGTTTGTITVTVGGNTATSSTPFTVINLPPVSYFPKVDYQVGTSPREVKVADFNGDGHLDIVTSDAGSGSISLLKGTGTGCFGLAESFPADTEILGMAVADLNGDGKPDMVGANKTNYTVSVFINSGSGFLPKIDYASGTPASGNGSITLSIGDVNADDIPDLVVVNDDQPMGSIAILTGNGDGTFNSQVEYPTTYFPYSVAIGDVNSDGWADLAIANPFTSTVSIFINNGAGGFPIEEQYPAVGFTNMAILHDFNKDGELDLATSNGNSNSVGLLLNDGTGDFLPISNFQTGASGGTPNSLVAADFNNDGNPDLAAGNHTGSVSILVGDGVGHFAIAQNFATGNGSYDISKGDLDEDGKLDIISSNLDDNTVSVLLTSGNTCSPATIAITTQPVFTYACEGSTATFTISATGTTNINYRWQKYDGTNFTDLNEGGGYSGTATSTLSIDTDVTHFGGSGEYRSRINGDLATEVISDDAQLTINSLPSSPDVVGDSDCTSPASLTLTASGASDDDYNWYTVATGGTALAGENNATFTTPSLSVTTTYYVSIRDTFCESDRVAVVATIGGASPPSVTNASSCGLGSVVVSASGASTGQYRWYAAASGGTAFAGEVNDTYTTPSLSSTTSYFVSINNGSCESTRAEVIATIGSLPAVPATTGASSCGPGSVSFTASGGTNGEYRWYTVPTGGTAIGGEVNSSYITPSLTVTTSYYVSINNGSCESSRTEVIATINSLAPTPTGAGTGSCGPGSVSLTASGGTDGEYRWYSVATGGTAIVGEVNSTYNTPPMTATTSYYVSINNGTCESTRAVATATINIPPAAPTISGATGCTSTSVTLSASGGAVGQYRWYSVASGGTPLTGEVNSTYSTPVLTTTTTYYVAINNGTCESTRTSVTATIQFCNLPPAIATTTIQAPVDGSVTVTLTTLLSDPDNNLDLSTLRVIVQPLSGALATIDAQHNLILDYKGISFSGTEKLTIEVCDLLAACSQKELSIEVVGDIVVFNGMSPNGDNKNDFFLIQYIEAIEETKKNHVYIYNRWGDVVFDMVDYDNKSHVFHGLNNNGNEIPSGTYFYKIVFASGKGSKTGSLSLKR